MSDIFTNIPKSGMITDKKPAILLPVAISERAHLLAHCRTLEELLGIAEQQEELAKKTKAELKRQIGRVKKMLESK